MKAWKFSERATDNVENFVGSKVFEIRKKLDNGEKLTREDYTDSRFSISLYMRSISQ